MNNNNEAGANVNHTDKVGTCTLLLYTYTVLLYCLSSANLCTCSCHNDVIGTNNYLSLQCCRWHLQVDNVHVIYHLKPGVCRVRFKSWLYVHVHVQNQLQMFTCKLVARWNWGDPPSPPSVSCLSSCPLWLWYYQAVVARSSLCTHIRPIMRGPPHIYPTPPPPPPQPDLLPVFRRG